MKTKRSIILLLLLAAWLFAIPTGEELDIEVQLLPTAMFNLADWNNPAINLWMVTLTNKTDHDTLAFIEFRLDAKGVSGISSEDNPVVWGVTARIDLPPFATKTLYSADFSGDGDMKAFEIMDKFRSIIETNGYLPSGTYDIRMLVWTGTQMDYEIYGDIDRSARQVIDTEDNNLLDISWDSDFVDSKTPDGYDGTWSWTSEKAQEGGVNLLENVLVNTVTIQEPVLNGDVTDPYPWFRWDSPGFRSGIKVDYRLKVAQFNPELHGSYAEALDDGNSVYLDTDWDPQYREVTNVAEVGTVQPIAMQFPSGDRDLACGYQYVWQVEAREFLDEATLDDFGMSNLSGIWGWPEPVKSSIYVFNFGKRLTRDNVNSPAAGSQVTSLLPLFNWEQVSCASEYELWISDALDDPNVENPIYQSEPIQSLPYQYPTDAPGLMPGKRYTWKIRFNPGGEVSPWSDVLDFTVQDMTLSEPARNEVLTTVLPMFNAEVPTDAAAFELRISDLDDENVDMGNIYSEKILGLPFQYPRDAQSGLFPGEKYYWKLILLDANDNMVGLPDDYSDIGSFSIAAVNLLSPDANERELALQPLFSWEGPSDVPQYELMIAEDEDPELQNPLIRFQVKGSFFTYPVDADYALEFGKSYYWAVSAMDDNENPGKMSIPRRFSIKDKPLEAAPDLQINGLTELCPCDGNLEFSIAWGAVAGADAYHIILSESGDLDDGGFLAERLFEQNDVNQTQYTFNRDIYDFVYGSPYQLQVTALKEGERHSYSSETYSFSYCSDRAETDRTELSVSYSPQDGRLLTLNLDEGPDCAEAYRAVLSPEPDMSSILLESDDIQNFPYQWTEAAEVLSYQQTVYLILQPLREGSDYGLPSAVQTLLIPEAPGLSEKPELTVTISPDRPLCPLISFSQAAGSQSTRIFLSVSPELNDDGTLAELLESWDDIRQTSVNLCDLEAELEYLTNYYIQVQSILDGGMSMPSDVQSFLTPEKPGSSDQFQFSISASPGDPCTMQISMVNPVIGSDSYLIDIFDGPEADNLISSFTVESFPASFQIDGSEFLYGTPYYAFGTAIANGLSHGQGSPVTTFRSCDKPGASESPEFTFSLSDRDLRRIIVSLAGRVTGADEYVLRLGADREMTSIIEERSLGSSEFPVEIGGEALEYSGNYYLTLQAYADGSEHGLVSAVQSVVIPQKPGSDEQTALSVTLPEGSLEPFIEVLNQITGADAYLITVASDQDMASILGSFELSAQTLSGNIPGDLTEFAFGRVYYFQVQGLEEGNPHGLPSSVFSLYIPQVIPPIPGDTPFNWEASIPGGASYLLEVSAVEDFSSTLFSENVTGLNYTFNMDMFLYNAGYFWRVMAVNSSGDPLSSWSQIQHFVTETVSGPELLNPVNTEAPIEPEFSWVGLPMATQYSISVTDVSGSGEVIWQTEVSQSPVKYPESAFKLAYQSSYSWTVTAWRNDELLSRSDAASFTTEAASVVSGLSPNNTGLNALTAQLSWDPLSSASSYRVIISSSEDMATVILDEEIQGRELSVAEGLLQNDRSYYWTVTALSGDGAPLGEASATARFSTPSLSQVSLLSPVATSVTTASPEFRWNTLEGASSYQFLLSTAADMGNRIINETLEATAYTPVSPLPDYDTDYYWQVFALDGNADVLGSASDIAKFTLESLPAITLKAPSSGADFQPGTESFSWEGIQGAAGYEVQISKGESISEAADYISPTANFNYRDDSRPLEAGSVYSWHVRAVNSDGKPISAWSEIRNFKVMDRATIAAEGPANGSSVYTKNPWFRWSVVTGAENYELILAADEDLSQVIWSKANIKEAQVKYPSQGSTVLADGTQYYWKVRALSGGQPLTEFSGLSSFRVSLEKVPVIESPSAAVAESMTPTFKWSVVEGAHHYGLILALDGDLQQLYFGTEDITSNQFIYPSSGAPPLVNDMAYFWRVQAFQEDGSPLGDASSVATFRTPTGEVELELIFAGN